MAEKVLAKRNFPDSQVEEMMLKIQMEKSKEQLAKESLQKYDSRIRDLMRNRGEGLVISKDQRFRLLLGYQNEFKYLERQKELVCESERFNLAHSGLYIIGRQGDDIVVYSFNSGDLKAKKVGVRDRSISKFHTILICSEDKIEIFNIFKDDIKVDTGLNEYNLGLP